MTEPTDAEIFVVAREAGLLPDNSHPAPETRVGRKHSNAVQAFARAVLAKWGVLRAEKIVIPTDTMEQEFQKHYRLGYEAGKKATTPQPTQPQAGAVPLTDEQIRAMCKESWVFETVKQWVRITEQHHGIKGGQHDAE